MDEDKLSIRGARIHNLKNVDLDIPNGKIVVITGPSGSGKSSITLDTIHVEGQRRYLENISDYPKQFLNLNKPDVDQIEGLSPTISIDERSCYKNPRSTVGTMTEIYNYIRMLFSISGEGLCTKCRGKLTKRSAPQIVDRIIKMPSNAKIAITAPTTQKNKEEYLSTIKKYIKDGYKKLRIDGKVMQSKEALKHALQKNTSCAIEVVIDEFRFNKSKVSYENILDSIETALSVSPKFVIVAYSFPKTRKIKELFFSNCLYCEKCRIVFPNIEPKLFSFNSHTGACRTCTGLGTKLEIDPDLIIPNKSLTLAEGAIRPWVNLSSKDDEYTKAMHCLKKEYNISINVPVEKLNEKDLRIVCYGSKGKKLKGFRGAVAILQQKYYKTNSDYIRNDLEKYMTRKVCPQCKGNRLNENALAVKIGRKSIIEITNMTISQEIRFFQKLLDSDSSKLKRSKLLIEEIIKRLNILCEIELGYLSLSRSSETISSGEARRIKLAAQLSSKLRGILYILDEPSIGLHQRDNNKLLKIIKKLKNLGNSILIVEHDEFFIRNAEYIIDMGPRSGEKGGSVVAKGTLKEIMKADCITGCYLSGRKKIECRKKYRKGSGFSIIIREASEHNLKNISVKIPLGKFVCVTGVSGSGKSTLINDILAKALAKKIHKSKSEPGKHKEIINNKINKVISIDQSPIGRTPRSNPATYTGIFKHIRNLFAKEKESRKRKYKPGHFSFNVKGGRCKNCKGDGATKIEMYFLPDVYVKCAECDGNRYNKETLEIEYKGANIAKVLNMTVNEAIKLFRENHVLHSKLSVLKEVGLDYMKLGQSATTLSGGEAQRIKLAAELSRPAKDGKTLYILDEPTVGLHFSDIKKLIVVLNKLVDKENTVLVIEHNMEVIKCADWVIDLGPEGGEKGGYIVAEGTPKQIAKCKNSYTGKYLKKFFKTRLSSTTP